MPIGKTMHRTQEYTLTPDFFDDWTEIHRRWGCYHHYGVRCCVPGCHRHGTGVVHWYSKQDFVRFGDSGKGEHIDLVGFEEDGTTEYLMTVDHIVPDSKGGPKVWWNLQPMCEYHNSHQQARMLYLPTRDRIMELADHAGIGKILRSLVEEKLMEPLSDKDLLDVIVKSFQKKMEKSSARFRRVKDKY